MIVVQPDSGRVVISTMERVSSAVRDLGTVGRMVLLGCIGVVSIVSITVGRSVAHAGCLMVSGWLLTAAAVVDLHEFRLPNRLLALAAALALCAAAATGAPVALLGSLLGGLVCGSMMLVVHVRRGVGMGDVKASAVAGMGCGSVSLILGPVAIAGAAMTAAAIGVISRRSRLALGPSLVLGWVVALGTKGWWVA